MLQHRTATDKVDILFGQRPFSQGFNKRLEAFALAASQYQPANHFVFITVDAVLTGRVRHRTMKSVFPLHETLLLPHPPQSGSSSLDYFSFPRGFRFGLLAFEPLVSPAPYFFFLVAVFGLQSSLELLIVTFNLQQIIIRKFTPLLLELALKLSPPTLKLIFVHNCSFLLVFWFFAILLLRSRFDVDFIANCNPRLRS